MFNTQYTQEVSLYQELCLVWEEHKWEQSSSLWVRNNKISLKQEGESPTGAVNSSTQPERGTCCCPAHLR